MKQSSLVLIVDDEPLGREALEALLVAHGYNLAFAGSGPEALAKAAQLTPDLILLDVMMPGMDGFETCQHLRADPLLADVPVIMVTALDDRDSRVRGIEAGADDFVTKPFDPTELRARVRTVTRLNRYRRLLAERTRFMWVVDSASDGYLIVDDRGTVLYANAQARIYLGLPTSGAEEPGEGESEPITETFPHLVRRQYRCEPKEAWAARPGRPAGVARSPRYLVRPETPDAPAFWLQVDILGLPLGPDTHSVVRLRDVSTQMAMQRDMWGFHEVILHKLRTPLTGMLVSMELLMKHAPELSHDEVIGFSQTAFRSAQRLKSDIEDIVQYITVPDLAQPGMGFRVSQIQSLAERIGFNLGLQSVSVSGHEDLGEARVSLSPQAFELALWEVLDNARKFHPGQAPSVEIRVSRSGTDQVAVQVRDDGVVLSPEQLARIWLPYYQAERTFTGTVPGMGLGLPVAATLIWGVGGSCSAYNREDGPGIVVELTLPLVEAAERTRHGRS